MNSTSPDRNSISDSNEVKLHDSSTPRNLEDGSAPYLGASSGRTKKTRHT